MSEHSLLTMTNINKSFNRVTVLKDVKLCVEQGEVHALLGENGAGKSTLMNILGGVLQPDEGSIYLNGKEVKMLNPRLAQSNGISFIHQELNVVADLAIYENMFLGVELRNKFGFLNVRDMCDKTTEIMTKLGVDIDPKEYVRNLDTSYKQLIEIAKALLHNSSIIIMDEPTSALAEHEVERLFDLMRKLKESGVSIIYISHKLKEIQAVCDSYTILRDGEMVGSGKVKEGSLETITKLMVGKSVSDKRLYQEHELGAKILEVKNLSSPGLFKQIDFTLHQGEILGFTGLAGDGRSELFESIFGFRKNYTGEIKVNNEVVKINHPKKALKAGIGLVPKDRKENAIIKDLSVIHNMSLSSMGHFEKKGFIHEKTEKDRFQHYKDQLNIKVHDPNVTIDKLSGGNQQKVVIAKWLEVNANVIIFDNPTQGIDVGAKTEIYEHIVQLAEQGKAIIILSSEAPEVLRICHNINVMYHGEIIARFKREDASEDEIMGYATGAKKEAEIIG
ncbi:ABC transporter [Salipaludibacillus neizhouensis]|uniref:ABC transporter n=1 Tax=Salipaludibacillus neizhouensis TaxID=885475 RepID=A0A3A9KAJ9_9BACI|nr:sugar ABC transporter ATP-binding protein [Salipaludibacillus neizhouensis]RKL66603.1 ABC transporter [Salipaludibacillus neizhouensis]